MPLAHNLNKVTKSISKGKGQLHIKGRKFKQLNRATLRDKKLTDRKIKSQELKEKKDLLSVKFFQEVVRNRLENKVFTLEDIKLFIESFISRDDEELEELRAARRPGRPSTPRQQILEEKVKHERQLYDSGFKTPDLRDQVTVERLRLWNGSTGGTTVMKFIHVSPTTVEADIELN